MSTPPLCSLMEDGLTLSLGVGLLSTNVTCVNKIVLNGLTNNEKGMYLKKIKYRTKYSLNII